MIIYRPIISLDIIGQSDNFFNFKDDIDISDLDIIAQKNAGICSYYLLFKKYPELLNKTYKLIFNQINLFCNILCTYANALPILQKIFRNPMKV